MDSQNKKQILFVAPPWPGHTNQLLVLAAEIARRGHSVHFASEPPFENQITRSGARFIHWNMESAIENAATALRFRNLWSTVSQEPSILKGERIILDVLGDIYQSALSSLTPIFDRIRPDLVVADRGAVAALDLAAKVNIPAVILSRYLGNFAKADPSYPRFGTPFLKDMNWKQRIYNRIYPLIELLYYLGPGLKLNRIRGRCLPGQDIRAVFTRSSIMVCTAAGLDFHRELPPNLQLFGPILPKTIEPLPPGLLHWLDQFAGKEPVVFVSLGTLATINRAQALALAEGLGALKSPILWSLPQNQQSLLPVVPDHFRIENFVPQQAVLAHPAVQLFVSHCGMNSLCESLYYGKPILGLPFFGDQPYNSARVVDAGVGLRLDKNSVSSTEVRDKTAAILKTGSFSAAAAKISEMQHESSGLDCAADLVETALTGNKYGTAIQNESR